MAETTDLVRPTPEHIAGLFRAHDLIPVRDCYLDLSGPRCGACAMGMLLVAARGGADDANAYRAERRHLDFVEAVAEATGWPVDLLAGIDDGFTSSSRDGKLGREAARATADWLRCGAIESPESFRAGFAIGWRAWKLVEGGGVD